MKQMLLVVSSAAEAGKLERATEYLQAATDYSLRGLYPSEQHAYLSELDTEDLDDYEWRERARLHELENRRVRFIEEKEHCALDASEVLSRHREWARSGRAV